MSNGFLGWLRKWFGRGEQRYGTLDRRRVQRIIEERVADHPESIMTDGLEGIALGTSLDANLKVIRGLLGDVPDLTIRRFEAAGRIEAAVVFFDTLGRADLVADDVIRPLTDDSARNRRDVTSSPKRFVDAIDHELLHTTELYRTDEVRRVVDDICYGKVALLVDGVADAVLINLVGYDTRTVQEPLSEPVVRGPRDGFIENLHTNLSLIRRRIGSPLLRFEMITLGRWTQTKVAIAYIRGLTSETLVDEVRRRLKKIDIDGILDTSYIEEFIEDTPYTVFPQVLNTERPDVVVGNLLEGRVAILCEGSPFALIVPVTLWMFMSASEDYYQRWDSASLIRLFRYFLASMVILLPSLYVAATTYHPEMLPSLMLISIAAAREAVPFSSFTEVLAMELAFEALREAGIRLPRPIGQAIGIVGAIVIGEAAVRAHFVSAPVVIIVAFTGIASFAVPHFNVGIAFRILRFPMLFLAGAMGLLGISFGLMLLFLHLAVLRSFGQPYLAPLTPLNLSEWKDSVVRFPRWRMFRRPRIPGKHATWREGFPLKPQPEEDEVGEASRNAPKRS